MMICDGYVTLLAEVIMDKNTQGITLQQQYFKVGKPLLNSCRSLH